MADFNVNEWEPRHNIAAFLDDDRDSAAPYRPMIAFLRRSRIFTAISANTIIYKDQVGSFWSNAVINSDLAHTRIISTVADREIILSEQLLREFFQFHDAADMPVLFPNAFINGGMIRMGYPGIPKDQYRKANLTRVWRYLMHVMIVCLSSRKAGFDGMSHSTASAMLALVYNKPFNFSGYIFRAMVDNVHTGDNRWNMYPRFIQLLIDHLLPGLPVNAAHRFRQTPMNIRIFAVCGQYAKGVQAPVDVPLFGHIINEDYAPPANHDYMDAVAAPPQPSEADLVSIHVQESHHQVADLLQEIDDFQPLQQPVGAEASEAAANSSTDSEEYVHPNDTPSHSEGGIPDDAEIEYCRVHNTTRYDRIQRRINAGNLRTKATGKRIRTEESDSDDPSYELLSRKKSRSAGVMLTPVSQPQPEFMQKLLADMQQMQQLMQDQAAMIESQAAVIQVQASRIDTLEAKVADLEIRSIGPGESGPSGPSLEPTGPESVNISNVNIDADNENIFLDYFASSASIPGQPVPLAVDYSEANITYLQSLINPVSTDDQSFDFEDVEVEPEIPSPDENYQQNSHEEPPIEREAEPSQAQPDKPYDPDAPIIESDSSDDEAEHKENVSSSRPQIIFSPAVTVPVTCKNYKVRGDLTGLIKNWKFDSRNFLILIKRKDGVQYFRPRFNCISTLPKVELNRLAQMDLVNHSNDSRGVFFERILRKEINSKCYLWIRPELGVRHSYKKKLDPRTREPIVKYHYPPAASLKTVPLEKLPLDFLSRFRFWWYDSVTGEAVIEYFTESDPEYVPGKWMYCPQKKGSSIRVFDPISLINLSKKDVEVLHGNKIEYYLIDQEEASKFQKVVDICFKVGIHAGGKFPTGWA